MNDVRALGTSAPVRAVYELSKRSGFHSVLFRSRPPAPTTRSEIIQLGNLVPTSDRARERALDDAHSIVTKGVRVFGRRVGTGVFEPWAHDPNTGRRWPIDRPWWRIDIRSDERLGDVKYVWEAARHRDLVVLARAARLDPNGRWAETLAGMLTSWCTQNPPERGVNWYSSLELALRAIAWSQVLALAGDQLPAELHAEIDRQLLASARHIMTELPYTVSSMKNNHLLGDALGLIVIARIFPGHRGAPRWSRLGERLFTKQLARHMHADGSMIEDSLSYHRFVLEMLIVRVLLGDAPPGVVTSMRAASEHLVRIGAFDGDVPQYGDWDEGRVLTSSGDALDVAGSAQLGLVLAGAPASAEWADAHDEVAWYAPPVVDGGASTPSAPTAVAFRSGGISYVTRGPWRVWLKAGAGPSHGHADLTSIWLQHAGRWVVADPGTGTYNGPLKVRNGFRTSSAHPVLVVDDTDQLGPHRAFRWLHSATGRLAPALTLDGTTILFATHDAYQRLEPGVIVGRAIVVTDDYVAVFDQTSGSCDPDRLSRTIPLGQGIELSEKAVTLGDVEIPFFGGAPVEVLRGHSDGFAGWVSATYGKWVPSPWLRWSSRPPLVWGFGTDPGCAVEGDGARVGSLALRMLWDSGRPRLEVDDTAGAGTTVLYA